MITAVSIDSREPDHIKAMKFNGLPTGVMELSAGDLWATTSDGKILMFERKTVPDLLASIADGRLFSGIARMKGFSPWVYLAVTGAMSEHATGSVVAGNRKTEWDWASVQGALMTVQELGCVVFYCGSDGSLEEAILRIGKRERDPERLVAPLAKARFFNPAEQILCSLPSIGPTRATALLEEMGTAANVLEWLTAKNSWTKVAGIGEGVKDVVRQTLGLDEGEEIQITRKIEVASDEDWEKVREAMATPY